MFAKLMRSVSSSLSPNGFRILLNIWSPFRGAGIKIEYISPDIREVRVGMKLQWFNQNYVGTHFGGSMYAMTDPFYMLILIKNLGSGYIVWDKAATIEFKKPGKGKITAHFIFPEEEIAAIKQQADVNGKYVFDKSVDIINEEGEVVATVVKTLYVRNKNFVRNEKVASS